MRYIALITVLLLACSGDKKSPTGFGEGGGGGGKSQETFQLNPGNNWNCCASVIRRSSFNAQAYCESQGYDYVMSVAEFDQCQCGSFTTVGPFVSSVTCAR